MSIERNDPRLTAYALGEMEAEARAAFEAELGKDLAAKAEVEAIRKLATTITAELEAEDAPSLGPGRRAAVAQAARPKPRRLWLLWPSAACAAFIGAAIHFGTQEPEKHPVPEIVPRAEAARSPYEKDVPESGQQADNFGKEANSVRDQVNQLTAQLDAPPEALRNLRPVNDLEGWTIFPPEHDTEAYDRIRENPFVRVADQDVSTFGIDVDTASYANVRRFLRDGRLPPKDAVRIEEMVNYFRYDYAPPAEGSPHPFRYHTEVATCPWNPAHRLARIALKGKEIARGKRPPANLVFLIDVSGSMQGRRKLPLLQRALRLLVERLDKRDRVAIAVYASASGLVLPPTTADNQETILTAIDRLRAGGSTNGGAGIQLAYDTAQRIFGAEATNRVILCTDGDFNVGVTSRGELTRLIEEKAKTGVYLSVLGFGTGNLKDATMEDLSNKGNGNYAYVDTLQEARKVLVEQANGTLVTIAKDVKIQVFFNPKTVSGWRLVGYENRLLRAEDFNDDTKDAGEIGAGHTVTAFYEIVPAGSEVPGARVDPNPFVEKSKPSPLADEQALFQLRLRYKRPDGEKSILMEEMVRDDDVRFSDASADFRWAAGVAAFGMVLRDAPHRGDAGWKLVLELLGAASGVGGDTDRYREECLDLVRRALRLSEAKRKAREGARERERGPRKK